MKERLVKIKEWFDLPERQVIFLIGLLFCNSMTNYILNILVTFLTDVWRLNLKHGVAIINIQGGASQILGVLAASLIDSYLGHYWMLVITSALYCIGLGLLTRSVPFYSFDRVLDAQYCPSGYQTCANKIKSSPFYWALLLIVLAKAGQGISLQALTYAKLKQKQRIEVPVVEGWRKRFIRWFCCCNDDLLQPRQRQRKWIRYACRLLQIAGVVTGLLWFDVLGKDWYSGFEVSACVMAGGVVMFLLGYCFFPPGRLLESPLTTMFRVILTSSRLGRRIRNNMDEEVAADAHHTPPPPPRGEETTPSPHRRRRHLLRCLNFVVVNNISSGFREDPERWSHIEQTKLLLGIVPISATFLMYGVVKSNSNTFFLEQGGTMKYGYEIPVQLFTLISAVANSAVKPIYRITFGNRIERVNGRYSDVMQIGLGMLAGLGSLIVASIVEEKRLTAVKDHNILNYETVPLSIFWLIPQFILIGFMDGLTCDGIDDFIKYHAPESMTRYIIVFREAVIGGGMILNVGFVAVSNIVVKNVPGQARWVGNTINESRLDYFFRAVVVISILNLFLLAYVSSTYNYQEVVVTDEEEEPHKEIEDPIRIT